MEWKGRAVCRPICLRIFATSCESVMKAMIRIGSPHSQADARFPGPFHRTKVNAWSCSLDRPHEPGRKRPQRSHDHTPSNAHAPYRSQESRIQERRRSRPRPPYAKNRSATRSPPASSGQRPRNLTQEAGSNPSVPDASDGKNPFII